MITFVFSEAEKAEIKRFYNEFHREKIVPLTKEAFDEFKACGKRIGYEKLYFNRRKRIDSCFMMCASFGEKYLPELCELLYAVCDENTWALPAHSAYSADPNNHNDIGSFIISDGKQQLLCDIGCGEYTADYFNDSKRYKYLCASSLGHSVPIIDGKGQQYGFDFKTTIHNLSNRELILRLQD